MPKIVGTKTIPGAQWRPMSREERRRSQWRERLKVFLLFIVLWLSWALFVFSVFSVFRSVARAQDALPSPPEVSLPDPSEFLALRRGQPAPRDGLLVDVRAMLQIQQEHDRLQYLLQRTQERDRESCDVRLQMERARTSACEERITLRDGLWEARQRELLDRIQEEQRRAERQWYESEALWFTVGAAVASLVWIASVVR